MIKRKIAVLTGSRAEYGLLSCLLKELQLDPEIELQIIVTGMHLSPEFGLTYQFIESDGFTIAAKVEMLISSDTAVGTVKSMGLCLISISDALHQLKPDILVLLGDRFETLAVAEAALVQRIPVAHIHGGELSLGAIDDAIRHAITKMAHLHFVAAETYRNRVRQLGENPEHIYNIGAPGLERISKMSLLNKNEVEAVLNCQFGIPTFLVTYHPATLAITENTAILENLFHALDQFPEATVIFTKANADEMGRIINTKIDQYVQQNISRAFAYVSLGDVNYLSLLKHVDLIIGNSSSGLIEAPYFHKPTVNIGSRQAKRLRASTIIDCGGQDDSIILAIQKAFSHEFQHALTNPKLEYHQDNSAMKIKNIIKKVDLSTLIPKQFHDLSFV
jgi:UDP-N-acetylglucosamine 2-epimerase (non-hydrolysing)/GDP/UDP-N,N'-diacetylbacillosamine 2-epimerase (hydrolysing)